MSVSPIGLLKTRRLWPLALTQSCGALNDNLVKNAMVVLALFQLGIGGAGLSALAGALFIAPYILLSATAGKLADRFSKPRVILIYKAGRAAADGGGCRSVPDRERAGPAGRADRPRRAGDAVRSGEVRPAPRTPRRGRTGRRQRRDRGDDLPVDRLRHGRGRRPGAAAARHRLGWRGRHGTGVARAVRGGQDPGLARRRSIAAHHAEPVRRDLARGAPCRGDPSDLAFGARPVLVLDHRRHADDRVPRGRTRHAGVRRHRAHAAAVGVRHRRRRRLRAVRAAAARRGLRAAGAVRRTRHLAVLLGLRVIGRIRRHHRDRRRRAVLVRRLADDRRSVPAGGVRRRVLGAALRDHPGRGGAVRAFPHDRRQQHHERAVHGGRRRGGRRTRSAGPARAGGSAYRRRGQSVRRAVDRPHPAARGLSRRAALVFQPPSRPAACTDWRTTRPPATAW